MKFKVLTFLSTAAILSGCLFDDSVTNATAEAKDNAKITVKVVDSKTGLPIDSALVYSVLKKDTLYTDARGIVTWKSNVIGDYDYIISKDGYASQLQKVSVVETGKGSTSRVADQIVDVDLHLQGVSVSGTILVKDTYTENLTAASKIPVIIRYVNGDVYPSEIETTTNASGVFTFENLAENSKYQIVVPQAEIDGQTYEVVGDAPVVSGLRAGEIRTLSQMSMEVVGLLPELVRSNLSHLDTIDEDADLFLTFSTELVEDSVSTAWTVYKHGNAVDNSCVGGTEVLAASTLDRDGKTVMINSVSNKWNRTTYCLEGIAYTVQGNSQKFAMNFTPGALNERPSNIKLVVDDTDYPTLALSWSMPPEEISGFKIYYRTNRMADAIEFADVANNRAQGYDVNAYDSRFDDATYVVFYVLPYAIVNGKVITSDASDENLKSKKYTFED